MRRYRVVVVGAGAAGLAAAHEVQRLGMSTTVLERDRIAASWSGRHEGLRLNTVRYLSGLPGRPIPRAHGRWVRRDDFVDYLRSCAGGVDVRERTAVRTIEARGSGCLVHTENDALEADPLEADAVVIATGYDRTPVLPAWPGAGNWPGRIVHAADYVRAADLAGRTVLVAGAGTSGLEIAVDLAVHGPVELAVRSVPTTFPRQWLGVPLTPLAKAAARLPTPLADRALALGHRLTMGDLSAYGLRPPVGVASRLAATGHGLAVVDGLPRLLREGRIRAVPAVVGFTATGIELADGSVSGADTVVAATGYRCDLESLVGHLGVLDSAGRPNGRTRTGLHFIGYELPVSGQLPGLPAAARRIGRACRRAAAEQVEPVPPATVPHRAG